MDPELKELEDLVKAQQENSNWIDKFKGIIWSRDHYIFAQKQSLVRNWPLCDAIIKHGRTPSVSVLLARSAERDKNVVNACVPSMPELHLNTQLLE